jgi:hypothetical protein
MDLIYIIYYVPRLNETIKIRNNSIILAAGELPGHMHSLLEEQGCTGLGTNMLTKAKCSQIVTNVLMGNRNWNSEMRYFKSPVTNILNRLNPLHTLIVELTHILILSSHFTV